MPPDINTPDTTMPDAASSLAAMRARYGTDDVARYPWNGVLDCLLGHRSVRAYLPDALPAGTLDMLVAAAQSAASSSNLQVWSVVAVEDPARKARLAALVGGQKHVANAPLLLVWLADLSRDGRIGAAEGTPLEGLDYLESFVVGVVDAALAAQNATVAAESLGLGTCYIGAMRNKPEEVAAELGLPPQVFAVFGLCVGRPDPASPAAVKPRLPATVVLHREQYSPAGESDGVAVYDQRLQAFQTSERMRPVGWRGSVIDRLRSGASLMGRDRLHAALQRLGFALR